MSAFGARLRQPHKKQASIWGSTQWVLRQYTHPLQPQYPLSIELANNWLCIQLLNTFVKKQLIFFVTKVYVNLCQKNWYQVNPLWIEPAHNLLCIQLSNIIYSHPAVSCVSWDLLLFQTSASAILLGDKPPLIQEKFTKTSIHALEARWYGIDVHPLFFGHNQPYLAGLFCSQTKNWYFREALCRARSVRHNVGVWHIVPLKIAKKRFLLPKKTLIF